MTSNVTDQNYLIGDIGGTNARFALADLRAGRFHALREYRCADFDDIVAAIRRYLHDADAAAPAGVCLAVAGPVKDGEAKITNNHWHISAATIARELGVDVVHIINDFEAIAYALPFLGEAELHSIGGPAYAPVSEGGMTLAVLGPGTGLGVAGLIRRNGILVPVSGEGGHVGCAPETPLQARVVEVLRDRFERVSAERLVAGSGVENIHAALAVIHGVRANPLTAAEIFGRARDGGDELAAQAVAVFFEMMGQVAGDLALTLNAREGVFIAGGIAKRYPDMLSASGFRAGFERKGRHSEILRRIPTALIMHEQPGLLGATYCVREFA